jgi:prolipoprotein diacylglyceryltransferase
VTFSLIIGLGAALGCAWIASRSTAVAALRSLDAGLWALSGGLLGGRLAHVLLAWSYYAYHPLEIPQIWLGGFSGPGAAAGFLCGLGLFSAFYRLSLGSLADELLPLILALAVSAWLACWLHGCGYGQETSAWWGMPARDEWGRWSARWPVQFAGGVLALLLFWILDWSAPARGGRRPGEGVSTGKARPWQAVLRHVVQRWESTLPGVRAGWAFSLLSLQLLGLSLLRADPVYRWGGLRLDTWAWLVISIFSTLLLLAFYRSRLSNSQEENG